MTTTDARLIAHVWRCLDQALDDEHIRLSPAALARVHLRLAELLESDRAATRAMRQSAP